MKQFSKYKRQGKNPVFLTLYIFVNLCCLFPSFNFFVVKKCTMKRKLKKKYFVKTFSTTLKVVENAGTYIHGQEGDVNATKIH